MEGGAIHSELSEAIIGAAMTVLNTLRPGLDEKLYERALIIELRKRGHTVATQGEFEVYYDGELIGSLKPDSVDDLVIADTKVVTMFNDTHMAQMLGYLNITDLNLALLLNFKKSKRELEARCSLRPVRHLNTALFAQACGNRDILKPPLPGFPSVLSVLSVVK